MKLEFKYTIKVIRKLKSLRVIGFSLKKDRSQV